ncbi:hypothetical protein CPC08DRAFT_173281 [Agrocybe pediades]|nr:hypothetical protein CPC08DRAFT_173281 [Agrocybe pediades]
MSCQYARYPYPVPAMVATRHAIFYNLPSVRKTWRRRSENLSRPSEQYELQQRQKKNSHCNQRATGTRVKSMRREL